MNLRALLSVSLLVVVSGCSSMTSSMLNRDDYDFFWRNSKVPNKGIPVTVKVPTHLKVWIEEEYYIQNTATGLQPFYPDTPVISVATGFDFEEKMFTVDFKRPGAGTIQTDVELDAEAQYFKKIHGKVVDNTIREITDIVKQFKPAFATKTSEFDEEIKKNLIFDTRTVAYGRFDINDPDFEQKLAMFFDRHITSCNCCQGFDGCQGVSGAGSPLSDWQSPPLPSAIVEGENASEPPLPTVDLDEPVPPPTESRPTPASPQAGLHRPPQPEAGHAPGALCSAAWQSR